MTRLPVRLVRDGEPVAAAVDGRPIRDLHGQINEIWDILEASGTGSLLVRFRVSVSAATQIGQPVYWNDAAQRFEPCRLQVVVGDGAVTLSASSRVIGIVRAKLSATLADVTVAGFDAIDLTASAGATPAPGLYYLAGGGDGLLTRVPPAVPVAVLQVLGDQSCFIWPTPVDFIDRHVHYSFELIARPAGTTTPPGVGNPHTITTPNSSLPGWLPAGDAIFDGRAPAGAVFGYNLSAHPALQAVWPPLPDDQATIEWDRTGLGGTVGAPPAFYLVDRYGLWWMTNCYGDVPWPVDSTGAIVPPPAPGCPNVGIMGLWARFSRARFATEGAVVTSVRSASPRITITCPDGVTPAISGDLLFGLNLSFTSADDGTGNLAIKSFDPSTSSFHRGPVLTGLHAAASNVTLSGGDTIQFVVDGPIYRYGPVTVGVSTDATTQLSTDLYRLDGVGPEYVDGVPFLAFIAGENTNVRGRIRVPDDAAFVTPRLRLRFRILGGASGTMPGLVLTARRIPVPPAGLATPLALPTAGAEFSVTVLTNAVLAAAYQYVDAVSAWFDVAAGETILYTLRRNGATDGYPAIVGLLETAADLAE